MNRCKSIYIMIPVLLIALALGFFYTSSSAKNIIRSFLANGNELDTADPGMGSEQPELVEPDIAWLKEPLNLLVVGTDNDSYLNSPSEQGPWRADVIILVQVDTNRERVNLLSIPRDTRTYIPGHGIEKIAHAHAYGEIPLTVATIEELIGVQVDHYISLDYLTFTRVVDILGGIEIDVPKETVTNNNEYFRAGKQLMNGRQVYEYIHSRDEPEGDIARINRQQLFLRSLLETVREQAGGLDLAQMYLEFRKNSEISLSLREVVKLAFFARDLQVDKISMQTLAGKPANIDGISYWTVDQESLQTIRQQMSLVKD